MASGKLRPVGVTKGIDNPSYLAIDSGRKRLFAVNELATYNGQPGGAVSAFAIEVTSGTLRLINQRASHGGAPCYLTVDQSGRYLLLANYMGGNVAVLPVGDDGALGEPSDVISHSGSSVNPNRQEGPHPHSIVLDLGNGHAFVPDLGLDKVMQYRFDRPAGRLLPYGPAWTEAEAGSGPRHLVFHPNGTRAYVINELSSTITMYDYDADGGRLAPRQTVSTLPHGYSGENIAADVHLTPDGRFLFGSNRGHDSIACFSVDEASGRLRPIEHVPSQGRTPRGFAIEPSGRFLLVANQDSDTIVTLAIDQEQGTLLPTGHVAHVPSPVCLKFHRSG
jgi:6-phosphogluconolactonase